MEKLSRLILAGLIVAAVMYLCAHLLPEPRFSPYSDEGYYFHYAQTIAQKGTAGFQELLSWFSGSQQARLHPPPSRVGFVLSAALLFKTFGPGYFILGVFSVFCFILFLAVNFHFIRKYFGLDIALLATLLLSSSPLLLGMARRALIDSVLNLWWALALWLFLEFLLERKARSYWLFLSSLVMAVLFKEGSVILLVFFLPVMVFSRWLGLKAVPWRYVVMTAAGGVLIPAAVYIFVLGGMAAFEQAMRCLWDIQLHITQFNPYVAKYCTGPWYRYLLDFMLLNPGVTVFFAGYGLWVLLGRAQEIKRLCLLFYFVIMYAALTWLQNNINVRFAMSLEIVMGLFAACALYEVSAGRGKAAYAVLIAVAIFAFNLYSFIEIFEVNGILDPVTRHLLYARHLL